MYVRAPTQCLRLGRLDVSMTRLQNPAAHRHNEEKIYDY
jgi:hypothetical protein